MEQVVIVNEAPRVRRSSSQKSDKSRKDKRDSSTHSYIRRRSSSREKDGEEMVEVRMVKKMDRIDSLPTTWIQSLKTCLRECYVYRRSLANLRRSSKIASPKSGKVREDSILHFNCLYIFFPITAQLTHIHSPNIFVSSNPITPRCFHSLHIWSFGTRVRKGSAHHLQEAQ